MKKGLIVFVTMLVLILGNVTTFASTEVGATEQFVIENVADEIYYLESEISHLIIKDSTDVIVYGFSGETITIDNSSNCSLYNSKIETSDVAITCTDSEYITFTDTVVEGSSDILSLENSDFIAIEGLTGMDIQNTFIVADTDFTLYTNNIDCNIPLNLE